jgi:hypothetical protein
MFPAGHRLLRQLLLVPAALLAGSITVDAHAQEGSEPCPCFSYEEAESIFLKEGQLAAEGGETYCTVEDYSVEIKAEVTVRDQNYDVIAQARVAWFDYDPSSCTYIDTTVEPVVERSHRWPNPAPEAAARACFDIISRAVEKSDTTGRCNRYP